jgi:hypothetical protein
MLASTTVHIHSNKSCMASDHPAYFSLFPRKPAFHTNICFKILDQYGGLHYLCEQDILQLQNIFHLCKGVNRIDLTISVLQCFLWIPCDCHSSLYKHWQSRLGFCYVLLVLIMNQNLFSQRFAAISCLRLENIYSKFRSRWE